MKSLVILFISLFISSLSFSQVLNGIISDEKGEIIPYATIFIKELNMGTTSNSQGAYQLNLTKGKFTIQFRSIGFQQETFIVEIDSRDVEQNVVLKNQTYQLHEIRVYKDDVDPAYPIMRRAVAMAPYYLNQVKEYKADVYIKGKAKLEKVPKLLQKNFNAEINGTAMKLGDLYVGESFSEIKFIAPDKYQQKIISSNMSLLNNGNSAFDMQLITESPYQPVISDDVISPLAPQAFAHYNYKYEGFYEEGDYLINKIKILPKRKSKQLFSGYLYIVDGFWCLRGLDLVLDAGPMDLTINIQLAEVDKAILLPVSHTIKVSAKLMGAAGWGAYSSSIKYTSLVKNVSLELPELLQNYYADEKVQKELVEEEISKRSKKINEIMAKEELSKADAIRLARLMKKEAKESEPEKEKSLEIIDNYKTETVDSATQRSDEYWELLRPNPLSLEELDSYKRADSLLAVYKPAVSDSINVEKSNFIKKVLGAKSYNFKNDSIQLNISSLLSPRMVSFNAVEGWKYAQRFEYKQLLKNSKLSYEGWLAYAFGMRKIEWNLKGKYQFAPMHRGLFQYSSGNNVVDYMGGSSVSPFVNTISSLFFKENYARYHQQKYFTMYTEYEPVNGLLVSGGFDYFNRTHLQNSTEFSFFQRDAAYHENVIADYSGMSIAIEEGKSAMVNLGLEYTPFNYYRIREGKKINVRSKWPTFIMNYKKGLAGIYGSNSDWDYIDFGIKQKIDFGLGRELKYAANTSRFLSKQNVNFADYIKVNVSSVPVEVKSSEFSFKLMPYYVFNTNEQLFTAGLNYKTPNLVLKYLPWISKQNWEENISVNYLTTPDLKNYIELGYSLSKLVFSSEVGVYSSFENGKYRKTGIRTVLRF